MPTRTLQVNAAAESDAALRDAVDVFNNGGLVVFPTETVYGIAARADLPKAMKRLRQVKNRPEGKPFTVHIGERRAAEDYVPDMSTLARRLTRKAWPGPLTVLMSTSEPSRTPVGVRVDGDTIRALYDDRTVGLRCPDSPLTQALLRRVDGPIVAASANLAGHRPPHTVEEALTSLNEQVDLALDGGASRYQRASTIVRMHDARYEIVREGVYDDRMLRSFSSLLFLFVCTGNTCRSPMAAALARRMIADRLGCEPSDLADRNIAVESAGVFAGNGGRPSNGAVEAMRTRGIDLNGHRSQALTVELVHRADHIFAMTRSHRSRVLELSGSAADKTVLLAGDRDIDDPVGADDETYDRCASQIEGAIRDKLSEIQL